MTQRYTAVVRNPLMTDADPTRVEDGWHTRMFDMVVPHNSGGLICHNWRKSGLTGQTVPDLAITYGPGFWAEYHENKENTDGEA